MQPGNSLPGQLNHIFHAKGGQDKMGHTNYILHTLYYNNIRLVVASLFKDTPATHRRGKKIAQINKILVNHQTTCFCSTLSWALCYKRLSSNLVSASPCSERGGELMLSLYEAAIALHFSKIGDGTVVKSLSNAATAASILSFIF